MAAAMALHTPARACVPIRTDREARYEGGDLFQQIARKAYQIDLFRVSAERVTRQRDRVWEGRHRISEYTLSFVRHEASPVGFRGSSMSRQILVRGFHPQGEDFDRGRYPSANQWLPPWVLDSPSRNGFMMPLATVPPEQANDCQGVNMMRPGQFVLVMRNERGELYDTEFTNENGGALGIDIVDGFGESRSVVSPTMILLAGLDDPYLVRMRRDILTAGRRSKLTGSH